MILLIDNYDSFSYNLYQLIGAVEPDIKVVRNDECTLEEIAEMKPEAIILSPGPGRPEDAGICIPVIKEFAGKIPILGVCLGHQSICEAFGGTVSYAKELMHGKKKLMYKTGESQLFKGLPDTFAAARYHSLAALKDTLPVLFPCRHPVCCLRRYRSLYPFGSVLWQPLTEDLQKYLLQVLSQPLRPHT